MVNLGGFIEGAARAFGADCLSGMCVANQCEGTLSFSNQLDFSKLFFVFNKSVPVAYKEVNGIPLMP